MTTIIWFSFLIQAVSGYLFGPSKVTGALGGSVTVSCYYNPISANIHGRKFWCKMSKGYCLTIMSTNYYIAQSYVNRTHLQNYRDHFKIKMTNLQQTDNGIYGCGIGNNNAHFYYTVNVTVSEGNKIPYSSEVIIANLRSSIAIDCPVLQEQSTGWKYWCKMDVPSCHTMVNSSGYVHEHFWGRVLIQEVSNTSDFKILVNNIKRNDFGFYRCGTGNFEDGSNWKDIHIHILNHNMMYQNLKPLSRSPGELVVAQCRVPTSFHTVSLVYWCRWNETDCLRLIDSNGFIQKSFQNRISLNNTNRTYIMSLTQLELGNSGYYWCVITDGQKVETSSVEVHVIAPTTTEIYISSISRHTHGNDLTATGYSTDISSATETPINITLSPSSLNTPTAALNPSHTVLTTEGSTSNTEQENTTRQQFINTARHQTSGASIVQLTAVLTPSTNSIQESTSTTSKNHVTGNITEYTRAFLPTNTDSGLTHSTPIEQETTSELYPRTSSRWQTSNKVSTPFLLVSTTDNNQETPINITLSPSSLNTSTAALNPSHTVLTTEGSTSNTEQENTTQHQFITTARHQTGGASSVQLTAVLTPTTYSIQESTSTTSKNHVTGNIAEYTRAFLPTNADSGLTHSTPIEQETTRELYPRTSSRWQTSNKVSTPFLPVSTTDNNQETPINVTLSPSSLTTPTERSTSNAEQENTTRHQFITTARHQTGGASIDQLTAVLSPSTNSIQESTSTTRKNHVTGNIAEYTRAFLPTNTDPGLTHSTPIEQETTRELYPRTSSRWQTSNKVSTPFLPVSTADNNQETPINVTLSPGSLKTPTAALNPSHTVLTTEGSTSNAEQENTTRHQFTTTSRHKTGVAYVPTPATNNIQESTSTTSKNHVTGNKEEYTRAFLPTNTDPALTHSTPSEQGIDYSGNITPRSTYQVSETEENYGISNGYKLNSEVTILLENSTVETQSKPGDNGHGYKSQVSNPMKLILILVLVLVISCMIGFATLSFVVINVRKKRATNNSVHDQENVLMTYREAAKEEIAEESEILTNVLTNSNNVFKETEV